MSAELDMPRGASKGRTTLLVLLALTGVGVWLVCALWTDPPRAMRALLVNFAYFTPMGAGMVVWSAVVLLSRGRWARQAEPTTLSGVAQAPLSLAILLVLALTAPLWASWLHAKDLHQGVWLAPWFVFLRDGVALLLLWVLAGIYVHLRRRGKRPLHLAGWMTFAYCCVISLLGFDLIMALDPHWYSSLFGGYYFISGLYTAVAAWTLATVLGGRASTNVLQDLGKLIVAFSLLTTYLMYSQLMPIWYENLPHEVRFILPRYSISNWRYVSVVLLAVIYLGPLAYLLTRWAKRTRLTLGVASGLVLAGMWVERWWLIVPTNHRGTADVPPLTLGWPELSLAVGLGALFVFLLGQTRRRLEEAMPEEGGSHA